MWLERTIDFWIAVAVAILIKVKTSESLSFLGVVSTAVVALGTAYYSSEWVSQTFSLPLSIAAGFVALIGEEVMRSILKASRDPLELKKLLTVLFQRGK